MHVRMAPLQALAVLLLASLASSAAPPPSGHRFVLTHVDSKGGFTKAELMRRAAHRSRLRAATMLSAAARHWPWPPQPGGGRHGPPQPGGGSHWPPQPGGPGGGSHWPPQPGGPGGGVGSSSSDARPALRPSAGHEGYLMELAIGTPPVPFVAIADTSSDLIWTQSQPCARCFPQPTPVYNPAASFTFSAVPCSSSACRALKSSNCTAGAAGSLCRYRYGYADGAYSEGVIGRETLTFRSSAPGKPFVSVSGVAFGAGSDNGGPSANSTGTVGLGRGPLSLVAQLGFGKFSYCLTPLFAKPKLSSPILFGSLAELNTTTTGGGAAAAVQTTPLVQSPQNPLWYYVTLEGISLGGRRLPIPKGAFEMRGDGTGGTIVDSRSTFTTLEESAFRVVVTSVAAALDHPPAPNVTSLQDAGMLCYADHQQLPAMPDMVLHFAGGADMVLHKDSYMGFYGGSYCLTMQGAPGMSILGSFQQQNIQMLFDITLGQLSFVPADCSKL